MKQAIIRQGFNNDWLVLVGTLDNSSVEPQLIKLDVSDVLKSKKKALEKAALLNQIFKKTAIS